jgi:hypothetical protein
VNTIPAIIAVPENFSQVDVPDSFLLPQVNPYCSDLAIEDICILIAGFLALAGYTNMSAATLLSNAEGYAALGTFAQDLQVPGAIYTLLSIISDVEPSTGGLVYLGNYGGVAPSFTPSTPGALATDSVTLREWSWWANSWH